MTSTAQRYAEQQRERLEQIRLATEKERLLLHSHRTAAQGMHSPALDATPHNGADVVSPSRAAGPVPVSRAMQFLADADAGSNTNVHPQHFQASSLLERLAYGTRPSVVIANQLSGRAQELQAQEDALRAEDDALQGQEALMERRVDKLNMLKKELLQRLVMLEYMAKEQRDAEHLLDADLATILGQQDDARERQRAQGHQGGVQATEQAQREAALAAGRKKLLDKEADMQKATGRMRQQQLEQADRVRGLEQTLAAKLRFVEDLERDAGRDELRLRDVELQAAADLRAEIERRQAFLAVTAMR